MFAWEQINQGEKWRGNFSDEGNFWDRVPVGPRQECPGKGTV